MIQVMFFLRFRAQLRRIRAELVASLEKAVAGAWEAAGGKVQQERRLFMASFDGDTLGFWLDMLFVIKTTLENLEGVSAELQGYSCVFDRDVPDDNRDRLCRALSFESGKTGIWCSPEIRQFLSPYVHFAPPLSAASHRRSRGNPFIEDYAQIVNIKPLTGPEAGSFFQTKIERAINRGARQNAVLLGPEFMGKRDGLYRYCAGLLKDIPPLVIRFGSGERGLSCFGDAFTPPIRSFIAPHIQAEVLGELDAIETLLFRERLRNELSKYILQRGRYFFQLLLKSYTAVVRNRSYSPILILENIHRADDVVLRVFIDSYTVLLPEIKPVLIFATCTGEDRLKAWKGIFPRIIKFSAGDVPSRFPPEMPPDLWEFAYAVYLLRMFFPGILIPRLFEEEGKNPPMVAQVFAMFSRLGVFDRPEDPVPQLPLFEIQAEERLGKERKDRVQALVRRRLLDWVYQGKLRPCFNLLRILSKLGEEGGDELILKTICGDIINGTYEDIERTIAEGNFIRVVGAVRSPALFHIFKTLKALHYGDEGEIKKAFQDQAPEGFSLLHYHIEILLNRTAYYLGINDTKMAMETVKKAMLLSQEGNENSSRAYRLFSLVNLIKGQTGETLEYISFSIENAEKTEQFDELAVAAYYAAGIQFLFGNLSKAQRLAQQAEETASSCGQGGWADRALFLRGKLYFETGRYQDALDIFHFLERYPAGISSRGKQGVLSSWIYRTLVYLGRSGTEKPAVLEGDIVLFELEAAYLAGDYQRILELSRGLSPVSPEMNFLYTEQPDWRSGFTQCEALVVPLGEMWNHIVLTYQSLAAGRLGSASPEGYRQAIQGMQRLTRNELRSDMDPFDAFYFYALYQVLHDAGADQIDMNTAVSMAFKRLQRRASRIDDPETRRDFLNLNYWNRALGLVAKEYKLI
jgi:tetratricopeptide (TPR) repeat protein